jgi:hypothetical protein
MVARSAAFNTAFFAVGEHTPAEQLMCLVAAFETTMAPCAEVDTAIERPAAAISFAVTMRLLKRQFGGLASR